MTDRITDTTPSTRATEHSAKQTMSQPEKRKKRYLADIEKQTFNQQSKYLSAIISLIDALHSMIQQTFSFC